MHRYKAALLVSVSLVSSTVLAPLFSAARTGLPATPSLANAVVFSVAKTYVRATTAKPTRPWKESH